jgi:succinate dehydrogenase hydrophobic anchor subunit
MFLLFLQDGFLRFFMGNSDPDDWQETATSWLIMAVIVAVLAAGLVFAFKALRKSMADIAKRKIWTRGQTWLLILIGIFPIFFVLLAVWRFDPDFFEYVQFSGLVKGTLFAWFLYLIFMVIGHLVGPWRRELI